MENVHAVLQAVLSKVCHATLSQNVGNDDEHSPAYAESQPVSPPTGTGLQGKYSCYIDHRHELYLITWSGSMQYPELMNFPDDPQYLCTKIQLSSEMAQVWSQTSLLGYGTDATVRCSQQGRYRVVKLAHPSAESRTRIQHEHRII